MDISCLVPEVQNLADEDITKCRRLIGRKKISRTKVSRGKLSPELQSWYVVVVKLTAEMVDKEKILSEVSTELQVLRARDMAEYRLRVDSLEGAFYQLCHVWYGSAALNSLGYTEIEIGSNFTVWLCQSEEE
jgi:hypothetical protein